MVIRTLRHWSWFEREGDASGVRTVKEGTNHTATRFRIAAKKPKIRRSDDASSLLPLFPSCFGYVLHGPLMSCRTSAPLRMS